MGTTEKEGGRKAELREGDDRPRSRTHMRVHTHTAARRNGADRYSVHRTVFCVCVGFLALYFVSSLPLVLLFLLHSSSPTSTSTAQHQPTSPTTESAITVASTSTRASSTHQSMLATMQSGSAPDQAPQRPEKRPADEGEPMVTRVIKSTNPQLPPVPQPPSFPSATP